MSRIYQRQLLQIVRSDRDAELIGARRVSEVGQAHWMRNDQAVWRTRCLHCRSWLYLTQDGAAVSDLTIEHIVPQSWFQRKSVISKLALPFAVADDLCNLALACARCNHDKGITHDSKPSDERAQAVILQLLQTRLQRYQQLENN